VTPRNGNHGLPAPFQVRDCSLVSQATGLRARTLGELRSSLRTIPLSSIYHHFWGRLLRAQFSEPEFNNDFASWAQHALHDRVVAEKLGAVNPGSLSDFEGVRSELLEILEARLEETEFVPWAQGDQQFHFILSQIIVFDTGYRLDDPAALAASIGVLPPGSIYYHFIDSRRRTPHGEDDFSLWLRSFGEPWAAAAQAIRGVDPYFSSLAELRANLTTTLQEHAREVEA